MVSRRCGGVLHRRVVLTLGAALCVTAVAKTDAGVGADAADAAAAPRPLSELSKDALFASLAEEDCFGPDCGDADAALFLMQNGALRLRGAEARAKREEAAAASALAAAAATAEAEEAEAAKAALSLLQEDAELRPGSRSALRQKPAAFAIGADGSLGSSSRTSSSAADEVSPTGVASMAMHADGAVEEIAVKL
eukprot:TRINITY_DN56422_c0_g1_i1.p1 TRINITY_DN56422_c0_g1~~TRINITY_DN56422_c0_g1_i1.p1  ORF type:complete len:218 (+),score=73.69 TRINITY_DN56422_c0_g1_i1:74-655(+)